MADGTDRDRARRRTAAAVLRRIDADTAASLLRHADADDASVARRLQQLEREWDVDRAIEAEAAATALAGLALGAVVDRRFLALPAVVSAMLLGFAATDRYPLLPLLRRGGVRTAPEIARERHALKALRGDFAGLDGDEDEEEGAG